MPFGHFMSKRYPSIENKARNFCKTYKFAERAVIQYFHKKDLAPRVHLCIHTVMVAILQ